MVVAVAAMSVVEMAIHQVVDVVAVRDRGMTASGGVNMARWMAMTRVIRRASRGIGRINGNLALVDVIAMHGVEVTIVQVVDVVVMLDREVSTVAAMNMVVLGMRHVSGHRNS